MYTHPKLVFCGKIVLATLPLIAAGILFLKHAQSPVELQRNTLDKKIDALVLTSSPTIIAAGESRAENGIVPDIIASSTGKDTVSIAVGEGFLSEDYDALLKTGALNTHRLVLISVSSYEINDGTLNLSQPITMSVLTAQPWGVQKVKEYAHYADTLLSFYIENFRPFIKKGYLAEPSVDEATLQRKGYHPGPTTMTLPYRPPVPDDWYDTIRINGIKQADFIAAIKKFGTTNDTVVIYIGPQAPAWRATLSSTSPAYVLENTFADLIRSTIQPYHNLHFIDFHNQNIPGLTNDVFVDRVHLNYKGAPIFSAYLAHMLIQEHLLP